MLPAEVTHCTELQRMTNRARKEGRALYAEKNMYKVPWHKGAHACVLAKLHPTLSDPMDCSLPPGSSAHGIFQARVLEWGAIAFSQICNTDLKKYI